MGMRKAFLVACGVASALAAQARPCLAADESAPPALESEPFPYHRFAVTPSWTHAFVPRSVSFEAIGLTAQTFFGETRRIGVGLTGALYSPFSQTRAAVPASTPASETLGVLLAEFSWVAVRGQRAELSVVGGVGTVASRPLSLVDPEHRAFSYDAQLAMSGGAVARVYLTREVALSLEARNVVYVAQQENARIAERTPDDPSYWYGARPITPAFETRLGLTVFLSAREPR
jgi:hypothetical protein